MATVNKKRPLPISEKEAERLADWFEHEAKPENFKPRKVGRQPLGDDFPSPRIQVRVPGPLYRAVSKRVQDEGTTMSALVRRLLEDYNR